MEKNIKNIQELDLIPLDETEQNHIRGGKRWDDKRHHRPGSSSSSFSTTKDSFSFATFSSSDFFD